MKNAEKYKKEIMQCVKGEIDSCEYIKNTVFPTYHIRCEDVDCEKCDLLLGLWLDEEYECDGTDWSKVLVNTPVLVTDNHDGWDKRYFAEYDQQKNIIWVFPNGCDSWSWNGCRELMMTYCETVLLDDDMYQDYLKNMYQEYRNV